MIIENFSIRETGECLRLETTIVLNGKQRICFFETPLKFSGLVETERSDAFVLALMIPAMMAGEDIRVEGKMSERLFHQMRDDIIPIMNAFNPVYRRVGLSAAELTAKQYAPEVQRGVGTGLSGGIDSFACIFNHLEKASSERSKLTHLFFFNVGSHGMVHSEENLARVERKFRVRYRKMKQCADELGLPLIPVNSNIHSFF